VSRLLALDLDGPILDPEPRQTAVLRWLLTEESATGAIDPGEVWGLKRQGLSTQAALLELGMAAADAERLASRWTEAVEDPQWLTLDAALPGVIEVLAGLAEQGTRPVIITARRHADRAAGQAETLGLLRWCSELRVVSPDDADSGKTGELRAMRASAFIGDTESDAEAANLAGVGFAAVTTGQRSREFLEDRGLRAFASLADALQELGWAA
jgi:phosphoglycolate phosphatase